MLKLVKNNLKTLKVALQRIVRKTKISVAKSSSFLPRAENVVTDNYSVKSSNVDLIGDKAKSIGIQKTGVVNDVVDSNTLGLQIAKIAENLLDLEGALQRLKTAKKSVRAGDSSGGIAYQPVLSSFRQYLPFFLGDELYAVSMATVQEVLLATKLIIDPGAPEKIRSAIKLDGSIVPVIDLSLHLGGETTNVNRNTLIIILLLNFDDKLQRVGIKADGTAKIIMVDCKGIVSSRDRAGSVKSNLIKGEFKMEHYSITLLDFNQWYALSGVLGEG